MVDLTIEATEKTELTKDRCGVLIYQPEAEDCVHIAWSQMDEFILFLETAKESHDDPSLILITEEKD